MSGLRPFYTPHGDALPNLRFDTDGFFLRDDGSGGKPYHHAAHHVSLGLHYAQTLRWPVAVVLIVVALCLALKDASA